MFTPRLHDCMLPLMFLVFSRQAHSNILLAVFHLIRICATMSVLKDIFSLMRPVSLVFPIVMLENIAVAVGVLHRESA
jgi:hypothetical protein